MTQTWCVHLFLSDLLRLYGSLANEQLQSMMNSPEFLQQMSSLMSNPAIFEQALALNPQFASIGPQAREMFQSERFRQMMFAFSPYPNSYFRLTVRIGPTLTLYVA